MCKLLFVIGFLMLGLGACQQHQHSHQHGEAEAAHVQLDDGKKWQANPETTQGIRNMQSLLSGATENTAELSAQLENEFNLIFKNCTMTGEAHEQLHNYLLPMKEQLKQLKDSNTEAQREEIQAYLKTYDNYFE